MRERIKVFEAARLMGVSEQFIRIGMQRGRLPIGECVKMSSVWTYYISPKLLEEFTGKKVESTAATDDSENRISKKLKQKGQGENTTNESHLQ